MKFEKNEALSLESLDTVSGGSFEETYRMASALFPEIVHRPMKSYQSWFPGAGDEDVLEKALTKKLADFGIRAELKTGKKKLNEFYQSNFLGGQCERLSFDDVMVMVTRMKQRRSGK